MKEKDDDDTITTPSNFNNHIISIKCDGFLESDLINDLLWIDMRTESFSFQTMIRQTSFDKSKSNKERDYTLIVRDELILTRMGNSIVR